MTTNSSIFEKIRNIPPLSEKNLFYYLYRGYIAALTTSQLSELILADFNHTKLEHALLLYRLEEDVSSVCTKDHEILFERLLQRIKSIEPYLQKMRCAKFIEVLLPFVSNELQNSALDYFLKSDYRNDRRRAYKFFNNHELSGFENQLLKNWQELRDPEILPLFLQFPSSRIVSVFDSIFEFYGEGSAWLDFADLVLRNRLIAQTTDITMEYVDRLKESDPISYLFAMKEANRSVDSDFAIKIFGKEKKGFLLAWFGKMRLLDVLTKIHSELLQSNPHGNLQ